MDLKITKIILAMLFASASYFLDAKEATAMDLQSQNAFIDIINKAASAYNATDDASKRAKIISSRDKSLCELLKSKKIKNWFGWVIGMVQYSDKEATIGVMTPNRVGNEDFSVIDPRGNKITFVLFVDSKSEAYESLSKMEDDDFVEFSGFIPPSEKCISMPEENPERVIIYQAELTGIKATGGNLRKKSEKDSKNPNKSKPANEEYKFILKEHMPDLEKSFVEIGNKALDDYQAANNGIKKFQVESGLRKSLSALLKDKMAKDWVGEVIDIYTDPSDSSVGITVGLSVKNPSQSSGVIISTANNKTLDEKFHMHTIINPGSDLYKEVSKIKSGDKVIFSGRFMQALDGNILSKISKPDAILGLTIFEFTSIKKYYPPKKSKQKRFLF